MVCADLAFDVACFHTGRIRDRAAVIVVCVTVHRVIRLEGRLLRFCLLDAQVPQLNPVVLVLVAHLVNIFAVHKQLKLNVTPVLERPDLHEFKPGVVCGHRHSLRDPTERH